jgi:hypothetical protein
MNCHPPIFVMAAPGWPALAGRTGGDPAIHGGKGRDARIKSGHDGNVVLVR